MSEQWWWRSDALCAEVGPDAFFDDFLVAKATCRMCPVREQCLTEGVKQHELGVWGGFGAETRKPWVQAVARGANPRKVARQALRNEAAAILAKREKQKAKAA